MTDHRTYFEGHNRAIATVNSMTDEQLLSQIDALYGRDRLHSNYTHDELLAEAIRQTNLDWLDPQADIYPTMRRILER